MKILLRIRIPKERITTVKNNDEVPNNIDFLNTSFQEQIGVPMNEPQSMNIFNFDETLIAKGYDRVVTTWQGMFWENSREDICFKNVRKVEYTAEGFEGWKAKWVNVFRLTKPNRRTKPRAHRFAVIPPNGFQGRCNPLKVGKFYTHVYQTKVQVGREMRTLHSKRMAKELKILCGNAYHPRKYDLEDLKPSVDSSSRGVPMGRCKNIPQPVQNFQPLSQIQRIPPYTNFINPSNNPLNP